MYDWPETSQALDQFWQLVCVELEASGITAPQHLTRADNPYVIWNDPGLLVGQTCGWPYANVLGEKVIPFGRFDYGLEGVTAGHYRSVYIGRDDTSKSFIESADRLLECPAIAMNSDDSQSGFRVFGEILGSNPQRAIPDANRVVTGSHCNSVKAVANGEAEIAAIDGISFELARRHEADAVSKVSVIGHSIPKPGLPLVTSRSNGHHADLLYQAFTAALEKLSPVTRETLMIQSVVRATPDEYDVFREISCPQHH